MEVSSVLRDRVVSAGGPLNLTSASGQGTLIQALVEKERTAGR